MLCDNEWYKGNYSYRITKQKHRQQKAAKFAGFFSLVKRNRQPEVRRMLCISMRSGQSISCSLYDMTLWLLTLTVEDWPYIFGQTITKTRLHNSDPFKPNFYIVKLGLQGYTLFFLFLLKNIDCGHLLEPPRQFCSKHRLWTLVRTA